MNFNYDEQIKMKSNSELVEIYTNPSAYQHEFVELAKLEIVKRNIPVQTLDEIKEKKEIIEAHGLAIGKQGSPLYMAFIGLAALSGGVPAIVGGYIYAYSTHSDINGKKYFVYNESTRSWGRIIFYIGVCIALFYVLRLCFS